MLGFDELPVMRPDVPAVTVEFSGYIHEVIPPEICADMGECDLQIFAHLPDFVFILVPLGDV